MIEHGNICITKDPEDRGSIRGRVIPKTKKLVLDAALLKTAL